MHLTLKEKKNKRKIKSRERLREEERDIYALPNYILDIFRFKRIKIPLNII